jgi:2-keto-3-deoxy-L-fuconate dehydrogenase
MSDRLKGKTAVITAAGQGIGRAIAEFFVREGATVHATDRDLTKLDGLKGAHLAALDVMSSEAVNAFAAKTGAIDVLVNAAGFVHHGSVLECDDDALDFSMDLNVKSMHRTIKAFVPGMLTKGKGSIVNIASGAGSVRGIPNRYVYGASKAAVIGLTKAVAADFIKKGIRANAICPGTIQSPSLDERMRRSRSHKASARETRGSCLSTVNPWATWAQPKKWHGSPSILRLMNQATQQARSISPMAALRFN